MTSRVWTADDVRALGVRTDLETAASVLSLGRTTAYRLARAGEFPVPVLRLGTRYVVPVAPLLALLSVPTS
ncbi:helix-turn-helix transcriptional regulator [Cellulomonas endometrii]|uniref:helix-turn-helix transcriptional regulator n=1 Tax=Cellulomonas endometrii TaxID=3036301 RepID=UPI0024ADC966|nr:helix-turn-helix domain-containing protein [Cellulomonas endometrii]